MKKLLFYFLILFISLKCYSQTVHINYDPGRGIGPINPTVRGLNQTLNVDSRVASLTSFNLSSVNSVPSGKKLIVTCRDVQLDNAITPDANYTSGTKTFAFKSDILGHLIEIKLDSGSGSAPVLQTSFTIVKDPAAPLMTGTAQAGTAQAGTAQAGTAQAGTAQAGTAQAGTAQAGTAQAGTAQAGTAQAGTAQAGTAQAGTAQAGTAQAGTAQAGNGGTAGNGNTGSEVGIPPPTMAAFLNSLQNRYTKTRIGYMDAAVAVEEDLEEENPIHIFFDQNGNNLLGTIPQGIANRQYIIHILHPGYTDIDDNVTYTVKQKTGSFNGTLNFLNNGIQNQLGNHFQASIQKRPYDGWFDSPFLLATSTDDLTFEISATTIDPTTNRAVSGVLETYTIKMSPVYHGSFDVGLINSELRNPTYTMIKSPTNASEMLIKETDGGNRGVVTLMANFYTSPVILIEKLFEKKLKKHIPTYKLSGRNFLDDHKFYERIYPAIGVSISSRTFENLFFGLNWEIARGLSIYGGGHWGKINTFNMPGYQSGVTPITQEQFDYYSNQKWEIKWAYGIKLDTMIITNLFK